MWEIKVRILGTVFSNETLVKLSEAIPLESCVREYRDQDKMWQWPQSSLRPSWLKCGSEYGAEVHNPWKTQEKMYDYSIASPYNNYRSYLHDEELLYHGYKPEVFTRESINRWFTPG